MNISFFVPDSKCIGPHCRKTFGKFLVHCLNGCDDTYKGHNAKCNNRNSETGPQFITAYGAECKRKYITEIHTGYPKLQVYRLNADKYLIGLFWPENIFLTINQKVTAPVL